MIRFRPYHDDDLLRLQATLAAWTQAAGMCGYCHVGALPHLIYEVLRVRGPSSERAQVWDAHGSIAGILLAGLFDGSFLVFVAPDLRGTAAAHALLQAADENTRQRLVATGAEHARINTDVYDGDAVRIELLAGLGFVRHRVWDHIRLRSLAAPLPAARLRDGFSIRPATPDDAAQLAALRNDAFNTDWAAETFRALVMEKPGYQPEWENVVVAPDGQIVASTVTRLDELNKVGLFEPVATRRAFQRLGLARAMMLYAMRLMQQRGMQTTRVEHDAMNQAASALYRGLGFRVIYQTLGYQR